MNLLPAECRQRALTYKGNLKATIEVNNYELTINCSYPYLSDLQVRINDTRMDSIETVIGQVSFYYLSNIELFFSF